MPSPTNRYMHLDQRFDSATSVSSSLRSQFSRTGTIASLESNASESSWSAPWSPFDCHTVQPKLKLPVDVVTCVQCRKPFQGRYRHGNLARHVKHSHGTVSLQYPCTVSGCDKTFKRTDARLKHTRRQHPESHLAPMSDRQKVAGVEITAVGSLFNEPNQLSSTTKAKRVAQQNLPSIQHNARSSMEALSALHIMRMVLTALHNDLGDDYPAYVTHYLSCWSDKVEQMRLNRSRDYTAYRQSLTDIETINRIIAFDGEGQDYRVHANQQARARRQSSSAAGSNANQQPPKGQISKSKGRAIRDKSSGQTSVVVKDGTKDAKAYCIGCPYHQRWLLRRNTDFNVDKPCNGCSATYMSEIRTHLDPKRVRRNHPLILYYNHCLTCKRDFIDRQVYQDHFAECAHQTMTQGDILAQWVPLCLTLFPHDELVPSPYVGDNVPLEPALVDQYRIIHSNQTHPLPAFSGRPTLRPNDVSIPPHPQHIPPSEEQPIIAMDHLLSDLVSPYMAGYPTQPVPPNFAAEPIDDQILPINEHGYTMWQEYLDKVSGFVNDTLFLGEQSNLNQARNFNPIMPFDPNAYATQPNTLTQSLYPGQQFTNSTWPFQQPEVFNNNAYHAGPQYGGYQQNSASLHHGPSQHHREVPLYSTPANLQPSLSFYGQTTGAATMSTQSSSQGWDIASSPYLLSTLTSPTSNLESYDPALLSPLGMQRSTSLRSAGVPEVPRLRRARRSFRSLREQPVINSYGTNFANAASSSSQQRFCDPPVVPDTNDQNEAASGIPFWSR
ncbi:hypothetical protein J1614_006552 [Plenodomus biglobosus]|nr:hypothetical protein J1614_006552 [Plenodomus biglobosus]